ncbi:MAG: DUF2339 domain-containing protein, partial [Planctomycetota bacterium]|nr:DUF2339 domain-containing protein [Planctomycetota bacterium]
MLFLWFLLGFFVGGFAGSLATALLGGFVGLTIGQVIRLRKDLDALQGHVASLEHQLRRQPTTPPESHRVPGGSLVPPRAPQPDSDAKETPIEIQPEPGVPTEHLSQTPEVAGEFEATPPAASLRPMPAPRMGRSNPRPAKQAELPRFLIRGLNALRQFLTGGNTLARVGLLVLLVGVVLLLKYAVDNSLFPVEMRMASAAGLGMALVAVGFWQRSRRPDFALVLQGGGLATMYLVVFFSYQVYALIPGQAAFGMLVGLAGFGGVMAVKQNSMALILIGVVGGFLAPILASTGSSHHVALFSYYLILNVLIAGVAWFKVWRPLNLIGFLFTFGIGTLWGVLEYSSQNFASTEPFLIAFFLLYVAIVVLFAWRKQVQVRAWVDGTLTFGTPLAFLGLQYSMVHDMEFAMAYTTLGMAAIYVGVAAVLHRRAPEFMRNLIEAFLALGIGFATLAVPYGFDDQHSLTGATWSVEGLGLFWLGIRQKRNLSCFAGVLLQGFACVALLLSAFLGTYPADVPPFLNTPFIGWVLLCAGLLGIACMAYHDRARMKRSGPLLQGFVACAVLVWYGASFAEVLEHFGGKHETGALVMLVALTGLACEFGA